MNHESTRQQFTQALDALVAQVKEDRSILAAILCGSLSHDTVWAKSDIDLVLVTIDDRKVESADLALYADGVNVHAILMPRAEFRKTVEGSTRNSFMHSFLAKGRLLYTHDPTIADLCATLAGMGARDTQVQLLRAATSALRRSTRPANGSSRAAISTTPRCGFSTPRRRWRGSRSSVRRLLADREVIPQAMELNPAFFKTIYADLLNAKKTPDERAGRARRGRRLWPSARRRSSGRSSNTCAKPAKRARAARSRPTSRGTST